MNLRRFLLLAAFLTASCSEDGRSPVSPSSSPSPAGKRVSSEVVRSAPVAGYAEARFEDVPFDLADWFEPSTFIGEDGGAMWGGLRVNFGSVSVEARCVDIDERIDGVRYRVLLSGWEMVIGDGSTPLLELDYEPWDPIPGTKRYGQMCGYFMEQEDYEVGRPIGAYRPYVLMEENGVVKRYASCTSVLIMEEARY